MTRSGSFILFASLMLGCDEPERTAVIRNGDTHKEPLIQENKRWAKTEDQLIDEYIERNKLEMKTSGTGLRYKIYKEGTGRQAREGATAEVVYSITLLDGTACYSSTQGETEEFLIGKDNVESGLHEGVTYMKEGGKALFIIPSHLAHGLTGDLSKIPPRATLIFDIELISVK